MLLDDFRQSIRSLQRVPSLAALAILTIALGVGVGTAFFSVVKAVLLNPLPYPDAGRLTWVAAEDDAHEASRASLPDFDDWQRQNHAFVSMPAYTDLPLVAGGSETPEKTRGALVTEGFFNSMRVVPAMVRTFDADEHLHGPPLGKVVIGYSLWQRVYGGDRAMVGRTITVMGLPSTVIGVMPRGFSYPAGCELWASARRLGEGEGRGEHNYWVIGRLKPGVNVNAASGEVGAIAHRLKEQYGGKFQTAAARVTSLIDHVNGGVRTSILICFPQSDCCS